MKQKISVSTALLVTVALFIGVIIITRLFKLEELPIQTIGVLFGGVITALITYFLLIGQTQAEENKERNVKVFEEKSERYNRFISELWKTWDDKEIELEELQSLVKLVTQDIVPYTNKASVLEILKSLNQLSNSHQSELDYKTLRKQNQQHIYNILKVLSNEIGLGGDITDEIQREINMLEEKILPVLFLRDFKVKFLKEFKELVEESDIPFKNHYFKEDNECYYIELMNTEVEIEIENFGDKEEKFISFFVEYDKDSKFNPYRKSLRGEWKDYLNNPIKTDLIPSFNNEKLAEDLYKNDEGIKEIAQKLLRAVESFYNQPIYDDKRIEELIKL